MQQHRQEPLRSATRRMQRGRKTTGRIVASALGLYRQIDDALAPDIAGLGRSAALSGALPSPTAANPVAAAG